MQAFSAALRSRWKKDWSHAGRYLATIWMSPWLALRLVSPSHEDSAFGFSQDFETLQEALKLPLCPQQSVSSGAFSGSFGFSSFSVAQESVQASEPIRSQLVHPLISKKGVRAIRSR